jgi:uncharacterized membrane protein
MPHNTKLRSIIKAVSYRIVIIILDFTLIYLLTKKTSLALGFLIVSNLYSTFIYFIYERAWNKIKWGSKS